MNYIQKIKDLLKKKKITKRDFAESIGKNENTVANYLTKKTKIDIETFIKISEVLGVSVGYFFEGGNSGIDKEKMELLERLISIDNQLFKQLNSITKKEVENNLIASLVVAFANNGTFDRYGYLSKNELKKLKDFNLITADFHDFIIKEILTNK